MESPAAAARDAFDERSHISNPGINEPAVDSYFFDTPPSPAAAGERTRAFTNGPLTSTVSSGDAANAEAPLGGLPKRVLDIVVSSLAIVLLAPLLALVAVTILITLKRPVLFTQTRIGHAGRPFKCYKFRSMVCDADKVLSQHLASDPAAALEWQKTQKLAHDPRVTFIGHMLRKSSIDELPQLYNVLRGDMSCVGPRPVLEGELKRYGAAKSDYLKAKPGMTGLWQVSGRNALSYDDQVALDSRYVNTWSLSQDVTILLKTVPAVVRFGETA